MTTATKQITFTPMQEGAADSIEQWFKQGKNQTYVLQGYAGTGKSTIVEYAISRTGLNMKEEVAFACYTGKAALVLTQKAKGQFKVQTIHRLIYTLDETSKGAPNFILKPKQELSDLKLIVIDEASMVDGQIMKDLKSFGIKTLFIGDQGQLPPVSKHGNEEFLQMFNNPDYVLTEIHRQAADNPIIHLSMLARTKQPIPYGWYGKNKEALVISRIQWQSLKESCYTTADQIICGKNKTRHQLNQDIRKYLGFTDPLPQKGDKLICIKNDWEKNIRDVNLVNGMTGYVESAKYELNKKFNIDRSAFQINFRPDFTSQSFRKLCLIGDHFKGVEYKLQPGEYSLYNEFDYGYAITCHKSQGSQWEKVVVINEVLNFEDHHRWLYTAITRSSEKLVLVM
ncbi:ATP-dependent RecD-like DNA helicase [Bacillus sp. ILBB4]|nr:ATP-dependent RecD-like DNA helicase [Bacillus sp. ILBB4]